MGEMGPRYIFLGGGGGLYKSEGQLISTSTVQISNFIVMQKFDFYEYKCPTEVGGKSSSV